MSDFLEEDIQDARGKLQKPLELKIQVIFGQVVGACLNTHPMYLWVTRDGTVIPWNPTMPGLLKKGHGFWEKLPEVIFQLLLRCLREFWPWMRQISEELAKNLDELRVDWLLGDDTWGCRIGEVTYMGTMALDVFPISWRLAKTFAAGHLSRRRHGLVEPFWPQRVLQLLQTWKHGRASEEFFFWRSSRYCLSQDEHTASHVSLAARCLMPSWPTVKSTS